MLLDNVVKSLIIAINFCFMILFLGCFDAEKNDQSEVKDISMHLDFHAANLKDLTLEVDLNTYMKDKQKMLEQLFGNNANMLSVTITGLNERGYDKIVKEMVFKQMRFLMQSFHNRFNEEVENSIEIISKDVSEDYKLRVKYNINLKLGVESIDSLQGNKFYIVNNPQIAALKEIYNAEPECFKSASTPQNEADYDNLFYYYTPDSCAHKRSDWQAVNPQLQMEFKENISYPEYDLIWQDNTLRASLFFTPANSYEADDAGVKAYRRFIQIMRWQWGHGEIIQGDLDKAYQDPLNNTTIEVQYNLSNGKKMVVFLQLWDSGDWRHDAVAKALFSDKFNTSDYISFNGHAGYGVNVAELNSLIDYSPDNYHVYYIDSCWSYSHNRTDAANIDFIGNIRPSYFYLMAQQNFIILKGLTKNRSYQEILRNIDSDNYINRYEEHNPHLAITGEENNRFKP